MFIALLTKGLSQENLVTMAYIIAKLVNGHPVFAPQPAKHATAQQAHDEVVRLAQAHPGYPFMAYQEAFTAKVDLMPTATADDLLAAIATQKGEFCEVNPFDGNEHSYIELGGWTGSQSTALLLIGLGGALGLWEVLTPRTVIGNLPEELVQMMAGQGLVSLQCKKG